MTSVALRHRDMREDRLQDMGNGSHRPGYVMQDPQRCFGGEEGPAVKSEAELGGVTILTHQVLLQDGDGALVEGDPALLVGLRVLLAHPRARASHARLDRDNDLLEVEVPTPKGAQLAPARAGRHRQPDEGPPRRVLPCLLEQPCRLLRSRRRGPGAGGGGGCALPVWLTAIQRERTARSIAPDWIQWI